MKIQTITVAALIGSACFAQAATTYYNPTSVTSTTSGTDLRAAGNLANGVGLDASFTHDFGTSVAPAFDTSWVTAGSGADYFALSANIVFTIDLGSDIAFTDFVTWAYGGATGTSGKQGNNVKDFSLRFATDAEGTGGFGTSIGLNPSLAQPDSAILDNSQQALRSDAASYSLGTTVTARYVEMTITDNYFGETGYNGGDRVGLGAVGVTIPEPSSAALLGLGGLALIMRRRK